jgi:hypothetical protein
MVLQTQHLVPPSLSHPHARSLPRPYPPGAPDHGFHLPARLRYLVSQQDGPRYLYSAVIPRDEASESALHRLVRTFFDGSRAKAVAALLDPDEGALSEEEMRELEELIRRQKEGR